MYIISNDVAHVISLCIHILVFLSYIDMISVFIHETNIWQIVILSPANNLNLPSIKRLAFHLEENDTNIFYFCNIILNIPCCIKLVLIDKCTLNTKLNYWRQYSLTLSNILGMCKFMIEIALLPSNAGLWRKY